MSYQQPPPNPPKGWVTFPNAPGPHGPAPQQPPKPKHPVRNALLLIVGGFLLLGSCSAILGGGDGSTPATAESPTPSAIATTSVEPPSNAAPAKPSAPVSKASAPKPTPTAKPTPPPPPPKPKPVVYSKISAREWKKVAKNPDAYTGKAYVIYGVVTQFDAATGTDAFRADVDGVKHTPEYGFVDYPTNTVLTGDPTALEDLVADDLFTAKVTVEGSMSYDTQIGGSTTVPKLRVASLKVTGSVD